VIESDLIMPLLAGWEAPSEPSALPGGSSLREIADAAVAEAEKRAISEVLQRTNGNKSQPRVSYASTTRPCT
jgi:hypothetical protein